MTRTQYEEWISAHYPTPESAYGKCDEATSLMAKAFPELSRVRGHYYCWSWGERTHWWLVTTDGSIVDPTASQFPTAGSGVYETWTEGAKEPVGKCPNCGDYVYDYGVVCSDVCARSYASYLMR